MAGAFSWFLALRYLRSRWVNVLGMFGVAVAVWALIVVVAVFTGFIEQTRGRIRNASPDILVAGLPPAASFAEFDAILCDVPGVRATAPRLEQFALYYPLGRIATRVQHTDAMPISGLGFDFVELVGIDPEREAETTRLRSWLVESDHPVEHLDAPLTLTPETFANALRRRDPDAEVPLRAPPGILLGDRRLDTGHLGLGQEISVVSAREPDEAGGPIRKLRRVFATSGGFSTNSRVFDQVKAIVHLDEMRELLGYGVFDPDVVSSIAVRAEDGTELAELAARIEARFDDPAIRAMTWEKQHGLFLDAVAHERGMMKVILLTLSLVSAFLIYATMNMMVTQKIKDIGILSAIGAAERGIRDVFLLCGATVGVSGCALGAVTGWATAFWLDEINTFFIGGTVTDVVNFVRDLLGQASIPPLSIFPIHLYALDRIPTIIDPTWVVQVVTVALATTLLAAWLPARRAARFEPVRALGYE